MLHDPADGVALGDRALRVFDAVQEAAEDDRYSAKVESTLKMTGATTADALEALEHCRALADGGDELSGRAAALLERLLAFDGIWSDPRA
jgi:hypothetical protein